MTNHLSDGVPPNLPVPVDDGAARHLVGMPLPPVVLPSTKGRLADLERLGPGVTVLYCYPRTGRPDEPPMSGWDAIPGARGCTPQACSYRDHRAELNALGAAVFGISTQTTPYQQEAVARLHLPFELLSDAEGHLSSALRLPTFQVDGELFLKRLTLVAVAGRISTCFYPVFPSDADLPAVLAWLRDRAARAGG